MRILITGSHGFVGRHFCKYFLDRGHKVVGVDNMVAGKPHEEWMFQPNDKSNFAQLFTDLRAYINNGPSRDWGPQSYDLIIHCAAVVGGRVKIEEDPLAVATDLSIDAELFNWVVRYKPMPKVIYFSSSAAYPAWMQTEKNIKNVGALREGAITTNGMEIGAPDMTYGWAKLTGEFLANYAHEKYGLDVKIYRPFGGYGEDQSYDYPFPSICKRVADGNDPVFVWGSGDQQRDFIHIDDVVGAVIETMDKLPSCQPLNLGTGIATSFFNLAELAVKIHADKTKVRPASVLNKPQMPEGVFSRVADVTTLNGWYVARISLAEGITRMLDRLYNP